MIKIKEQILYQLVVAISIVLFSTTNSFSQNKCVLKDSIKVLDYNNKTTDFTVTIEDIDGTENNKYFIFHNPTKDTLYIFASYFKKKFYESPILNRINKKYKEKKLCLLPLVNYLSPNLSDLIMLTDTSLINRGQLNYSFIQIPPNKSCSVIFDLNLILNDRFAKDINVKDLTYNDKIKWKEINEDKKINYKKIIEFAIYNFDPKNLCDINYYVSKTDEYFQLAKSYKVYRLEKKNGNWVMGNGTD